MPSDALAQAAQQNRELVSEYYGSTLKSNADLKTTACCAPESVAEYLKPILAKIHPDVHAKFYGCGSPIPAVLEGLNVLDLGSGSGRDVYVLSALAGPNGRVIGVDMTPEQIETARAYQAYHAEAFGFANTEFRLGNMEQLSTLGIPDASIDLVVSNCVLNLAADKRAVFREIWRVLKPGGELFFSDVYSDRRLPVAQMQDPVLLGECLSGALYVEDFRRIMAEIGCPDVRLVAKSPIALRDPDIEAKIGFAQFQSMTYRAFKTPLEDRCEDFGQVATYLGSISQHPHRYALDDHHLFERGKPMLICGNTAAMLSQSRLAPHFRVQGDQSVHYGLFDCGPTSATVSNVAPGNCC